MDARDWQRGQVSGCQLRWQGGAQLRKTVVDGRPGLTWGHDVLQYALRLLPLWNLPPSLSVKPSQTGFLGRPRPPAMLANACNW